jgi:hypothetical protein
MTTTKLAPSELASGAVEDRDRGAAAQCSCAKRTGLLELRTGLLEFRSVSQGAFGSAPRGAAFLCLTGTADIATEGCKTAVNSSTSPALYANWEGGDHVGTATLLGFITGDAGTKQYQRLYTAWFRCFLADDSAACNMFKGGAACPVCMDMGWAKIFAKNI